MKRSKEMVVNDNDSREFRLFVADTFCSRLVGIFSSRSKKYDGILIKPCNSVHTFFLGRSIDVLFLSKDMRIIKVVRSMRSNRVSVCFNAASVVEFFSDQVEVNFLVGDKING